MNAISCRGVHKVFGTGTRRVAALENICLDVRAGEFVTLVGASGCGKSTLLRTVAGLEVHSSGEIYADGSPVRGPGAERAMVFQNCSLYPWLTVMGNIKFPRQLNVHTRNRTTSDVEIASGRADALLQLMGLEQVADAYPSQLSGGMQQRVAIARALMAAPPDPAHGRAVWRARRPDAGSHARLDSARLRTGGLHSAVRDARCRGGDLPRPARRTHGTRPGRIDSTYDVPLPRNRTVEMKHSAQFLALKARIVERIRDTSGLRTDLELLQRLAKGAQ